MFEQACNEYFKRGWTPLALGLDTNGYPKRPLAVAWTSIPHTAAAVRAQPWADAKGIGLALGAQSSNLAAMDIDDVALGQAVVAALKSTAVLTRAVWTIRKRAHLFFIEETASRSVAFSCQWRGRRIKIELKANGTQVATVPTPGYELAIDAAPRAVPSLRDAWLSLCRHMGIEQEPAGVQANYPKAWQETVPIESRNKAAYIEAHKLREAGLSLEQAKATMAARFDSAYEKGQITLAEILRTVESAYSKGEVTRFYDRPVDESNLLP